jgi:hypothetical protein
MSVGEVSRERVEQRLVSLDEAFESFPVNQTTLTVAPETYRQVREQAQQGLVDAYVQLSNDAGQVLLGEGDGGVDPVVEPSPGETLVDGVCRAIDDLTGVECTLTGLERVTILGVCREDADEPDPVYRLVVVFAGDAVGGTAGTDFEWVDAVPESALPAH